LDHHFNKNGEFNKRHRERMTEIKEELKCNWLDINMPNGGITNAICS
jgi:hypothetical protein